MYRAPVDEIAHTLKSVAGLRSALEAQRFGDLGEDIVDAILAEAGRFASDEIAPLNEIGDKHGAVLKDGAVTTPPGWKDLYHNWIAGGWNGLTGPEEFGGQGLPMLLSVAALEMWNSGSLAFGIGPTLTMGAVEALEKHASDDLKAKYLEKLVTGEWMGTMNLTEPQAGSDLNALKARAEPNGDGTYTVGMTMIATGMAGQLVAFTAKKAGKTVNAGKSCATIESGKWVGPAKIAFDAEIVAVNDTLSENPKLANSDTYGEGWMVKVKPSDDSAVASLTPGTAVAGPYEAKMAADEFAGCA